jgi:predicted CXXCH cytochrome family protein
VEEFRRSGEPKPAPLSGTTGDEQSSMTAGAGRIAGYAGAASCRECHPGESALYARSGHRQTLWPVTTGQNPVVSWLEGKTWKDPEVPEVTWSYHVNDGRLVARRTVGGRTESFPLDYGIGSGKHGVTFVALRPGADPGLDPAGVEHRLSYLAHDRSVVITPGQQGPAGDRLGPRDVPWGKSMRPDAIQQCFKCHSTLTSTLAANRLETSTLIPNVSCERCHGPGRSHIEAARRGQDGLTMPMGRDRAEPWVEVNLCGECHRRPRDVSSAALRPENIQLVRYQGVGISLSWCYADGRSGLRCASCHDPHDRASTDRVKYEAVCLSCHGSVAKPKSKPGACPVSPAIGCIECHMPRRELPGNGWFTDHWIRNPARPAKPGGDRPPAAAAAVVPPSSPAS